MQSNWWEVVLWFLSPQSTTNDSQLLEKNKQKKENLFNFSDHCHGQAYSLPAFFADQCRKINECVILEILINLCRRMGVEVGVARGCGGGVVLSTGGGSVEDE